MFRNARLTLELLLLRGPVYRFAFIAVVVAIVSLLGGMAILMVGDGFDSLGSATWWSFLRLTDPGYLGDDEDVATRLVSVPLAFIGMVLVLGALVAIMTTWLNETLERLERGETPLASEGHLLVVGWTDRSAAIITEFLLSTPRVERFLTRTGRRTNLQVVLMVEHLDPSVQADIALRLGHLWDRGQVVLRAGSRLRAEHLERVAFDKAAAILLPGDDTGEAAGDIAALKTLMSIANHPLIASAEQPPRVVAEVFDARKAELARTAYAGTLDVLASDLHLSRVLVQNLRHPGLSFLFEELLTHHHGTTIFAPQRPELAGLAFAEAATRFGQAVLLGAVRPEGDDLVAHLAPGPTFRFGPDDRAVLVAHDYAATEVGPPTTPWSVTDATPLPAATGHRSILVLGWTDKLPAMLAELGAYERETFDVTVLGTVPIDVREAAVVSWGGLAPGVTLTHLEGDYTLPSVMETAEPWARDHVLLLETDWMRTDEQADARTIVGYLTLRRVLDGRADPPEILLELSDPANAGLFDAKRGEVVVSPLIVSHMLAHVTLRAEVLPVFDALFRAGGPTFLFRSATDYGLTGTVPWPTVQAAVARTGHVALGWRPSDATRRSETHVAPPEHSQVVVAGTDVIVLAPVEVGG